MAARDLVSGSIRTGESGLSAGRHAAATSSIQLTRARTPRRRGQYELAANLSDEAEVGVELSLLLGIPDELLAFADERQRVRQRVWDPEPCSQQIDEPAYLSHGYLHVTSVAA